MIVSLSHYDHFKTQTSTTVSPIVITDRKANQYIDLCQLLALGNRERPTNNDLKTKQKQKTHATCLNKKKNNSLSIHAAVITSSPNRAGLLFYHARYDVNKREHAEAGLQKVYLGY